MFRTLLYIYVWLTWLRFFRVFSQLLGKCQGKTRKDGARPALLLIFVFFCVLFVLFYVFLCCSMYCLFCVVLCIVCVYMCTELLPPGGYPIAIKYIISYLFAYEDGTDRVPKRRHIKFRRRGTTQKKEYNIQNRAKIWNPSKSCSSLLWSTVIFRHVCLHSLPSPSHCFFITLTVPSVQSSCS